MTAAPLTIGKKAPALTLQTAGGKTIRLSDFLGQNVALYFYSKDDTPGCTKEACSFQKHRAQLAAQRAVVLGVSRDDVASHQRFADKFGLTFPLLSDPDAAVSKAYGVYKQKSMYGRTYWGIERTTFIIDAQGRITAIFPKVQVDGHTQEVLDALTGSRSTRATAPPRPVRAKH